MTSTGAGSNPAQGAAVRGVVHGGQQPLAGAHVYLLAVNTTGYGGPGIAASSSNQSASLLTNVPGTTTEDGSGNYYVTTDSNGAFTITNDYTCPSPYAHPYLYAAGGDPGTGPNTAAVLLAPVDSCGGDSAYVVVNEVSTIALAYAFAGFSSDPTHISSSNSALAAIGTDNAAEAIANLETINTGQANSLTPAGNGTVPQAEINTVANILAACVNSTGPTSTPCTTLFTNAKNGAITPTDTATAALNIAHNPGANVASLFSLQAGTSPFQPSLSTTPNDFTVAISYTGGGDFGIAIDKSGNVWVTNDGPPDGVSEFSSVGKSISGLNGYGYTGGGLQGAFGIAIDSSGNVWVANSVGYSLSEFNSSGTAISGSNGYTGGGLYIPKYIAIDTSGNVWVTNQDGNRLSEFNSSGTAISSSNGFTGGGLDDSWGIAIDTSGNVWVANGAGRNISEFNSSGTAISGSNGYTGGGLTNPLDVALDLSGDLWAVSNTGDLSELSSSGTAISDSNGFVGGGLYESGRLAIDGSGDIWVANAMNKSQNDVMNGISEFNSSGTAISGSNGYQGGQGSPQGIAIDGSGNVWVTTNGYRICEFVGAATPVVTPIVGNLLPPYGTHAVNRP